MIGEFLELAKRLNTDLGIIPVLFGSLGMEIRTSVQLNPEDIDVLIPKKYLNQHWDSLIRLLNEMGYKLVDLQEHEFKRGEVSIAFAEVEGLDDYAGITVSEIEKIEMDGVQFKLLNEEQYYKIYSKCLLDSYRQSKKDEKDRYKLKILAQLIKSKET